MREEKENNLTPEIKSNGMGWRDEKNKNRMTRKFVMNIDRDNLLMPLIKSKETVSGSFCSFVTFLPPALANFFLRKMKVVGMEITVTAVGMAKLRRVTIETKKLRRRGIRFVNLYTERIPWPDKQINSAIV